MFKNINGVWAATNEGDNFLFIFFKSLFETINRFWTLIKFN